MLYHFSEDPSIEQFEPRTPLHRPEVEPAVWAIEAWTAPKYLFPRDCPRVCFWPAPTTTPDDYERFYRYVDGRMVTAIEAAWLHRLTQTTLYRYVLPAATFEPLLNEVGTYISRHTVVPLGVEPVGDLMTALVAAPVELRICQSLVPLGLAIIASTMDFSLIRMRNARGWPLNP